MSIGARGSPHCCWVVKAVHRGQAPRVPSEYFDALAGIQQMASDQVHEGSWQAWNSGRLRTLLELTKNVLHEMYVVPKEQENRASIANQMLSELKADKSKSGQKPQG